MSITGNPYEEYHFIKMAYATGYTVAQVRTITRLEVATQRGYEAECRMARRGDAFTPCVEDFKVEHDERLSLPRVTFYDSERDWMQYSIVVRDDGTLDYEL